MTFTLPPLEIRNPPPADLQKLCAENTEDGLEISDRQISAQSFAAADFS